MAKNRIGLQKNFSKIFEGVWIPRKTRARGAFAAAAQDKELHKRKMERIISQMKCSKGFECCKSGFKNLCKVKKAADTGLIECSPENQQPCEFRYSFMDKSFCNCQLRCFIAENLHR